MPSIVQSSLCYCTLNDEEISALDDVTAQSARIAKRQDRVSFSLKNVEKNMLQRGREVVKGPLNWIGLFYGLNPEDDPSEYGIKIFE